MNELYIAAGKNAAVMVDRYLSGRQMKVLKHVKLPTVYIEPVAEPHQADGGHAHAHHRAAGLDLCRRSAISMSSGVLMLI